MKNSTHRIAALMIVVWSSLLAGCAQSIGGLAVSYREETQADPPQRLFIATVDLTNPNVRVRVAPGGPDPDGGGQWETTLMRPTQVAAREGFDLVVNGDFFDARNIKDAEGPNSPYRSEIWAGVLGPAMTDGRAWSSYREERPCLVVYKNRKVRMLMLDKPPTDAWQVIAGNAMIVDGGKAVPRQSKARHPRTVIGLDRSATKLTILVVDGRQKGVATGMSYEELSREMLKLGCWQAINLDGGGSTVMAVRQPNTGEYKILNTPSDGRERAVANVLGVSVGDGHK